MSPRQNRGFTVIEVLASLFVAGVGFYGALQGFKIVAASRTQTNVQTALSEIQNDIVATAYATAKNYFTVQMPLMGGSTCTNPLPFNSPAFLSPSWQGCTPGSPTATSFNCSLSSGLTMQILDTQHALAFFGNYPAVPNDPSYGAALSRCENNLTFYETVPFHGIPVPYGNYSAANSIYFCASLTATPSSSLVLPNPAIGHMQPVLVEFLFTPFDLIAGAPLSCSQVAANGGMTNSNIGMLYYTIHWSLGNLNGGADANGRNARTFSGIYVGQ